MNDRQPIIISHAECIDGFTAAWVAWLKHGSNADYIFALYGDAPPDVRGKDVLIVDFSYPRAVLERMHSEAKTLRVLDHHRTAQADLEGLDYCTFDMNRSGAGLAWDELHGVARPALVNYVEDRDLWRFALPESKEINAYISSREQSFVGWNAMHLMFFTNEGEREIILGGRGVLAFIDRYVSEMKKVAGKVMIGDYIVPIVNAPYINTSELVGELAEGQPFALGWYQQADGSFKYSLRSRGNYDVSELAKRYGGGGHRQAAGFVSQSSPDVLFRAKL